MNAQSSDTRYPSTLRTGHPRKRRRYRLAAAVLAGTTVVACSTIVSREVFRGWTPEQHRSFDTFQNIPLPADFQPSASVASVTVPWDIDPDCRNHFAANSREASPPRATVLDECRKGIGGPPRKDTNFVSLSISGGGTKSAVFSTEVLFALQGWGLLQHVDVVSSVSGGSFTAALYGASCDPQRVSDNSNFNSPLDNCDRMARNPNESANSELRRRIPWSYDKITKLVSGNVFFSHLLKKFNPADLLERGLTNRSTADILAENLAGHLFEDASPARGTRFADLNPRRPNIVLNATNTVIMRRFIEAGAGIDPTRRRLRLDNEDMHFAFLDYYFRDLLRSNLSEYPLSYGVAASAAFPLIIDYVTVGQFPSPAAPESKIGFIHLTDGGAQDNHGLTEVVMMLRDIFRASAELVPERVLSLVIDSSLSRTNGTDGEKPSARGIESAFMPIRPGIVSESVDRSMESNADLRKRAFERYLDDIRQGHGGRMRAARMFDVGLNTLDRFHDRYFDGERPEDARAKRAAVAKIGDSSFRSRLGLGGYHPQCYFDPLSYTPTHFKLDADVANCLRHAARWSVALRMVQLCNDPEFRDAGAERAAVGIDCRLLDRGEFGLPPLPACEFGKIYKELDYRPDLDPEKVLAYNTVPMTVKDEDKASLCQKLE